MYERVDRFLPAITYVLSTMSFFDTNVVTDKSQFLCFRSTPPSRPNNIREGNVRPSVGSLRPYVRPQNVCPISMKFGVYIEGDE